MAINILIVDDSSVMRAMIIKTIRMSGIPVGEIHQGANGKEGLELLNNNWIDLLVVDINMPVMNGEEMIDRVRQTEDVKDIPILVISTEGSRTRIERLKSKVDGFVQKPFSPETIRDTVQKMMGV